MAESVKKIIFLLLPFAFFSGCFTAPSTNIYTINSKTLKIDFQKSLNEKILFVLPVDAPSILRQPYIVSKNSPYKVEILKYQKWDASPKDIIYRTLVDFGSSIGFKKSLNPALENHYTLKSRLSRFERILISGIRYADFEIEIEFYSPENNLVFSKNIHKRKTLASDDTEVFAASLSEGLKEGLKELEQEFRNVFIK